MRLRFILALRGWRRTIPFFGSEGSIKFSLYLADKEKDIYFLEQDGPKYE